MSASSPEFQHLQMSVGSQHLSARVTGTGQPIVLFHSLLADQSSWDAIVPKLAKTHQVIVLNLPGFGDSDFVGASLDVIADHIAQAITSLALKLKPVLMGNGYGGFVALNTAIRHPDLASRLVLADCGAAFSDTGRAAFMGMSATSREKGLVAIADVAMRRLFAPEFQKLNPTLIEERKKKFLAVDPTTFHGACESLSKLDLRDKLAGIKLPTLVLVGEQDEATPPPMSQELHAGVKGSKLTVLKGCAHVPQLQAPDQFMAAVKDFIAA